MGLFKGQKDQITLKRTARVESDMGRIVEVPFKVTYKKLPVSDARQLLADLKSESADEESADEALMLDNVLDWEMPGDNGELVPFNEDNLRQAMNIREYKVAIVGGFMEVTFGRKAQQAKNF